MISNFTLSCTHAPFWLWTTCSSACISELCSADYILIPLVIGLVRPELHAYIGAETRDNMASSVGLALRSPCKRMMRDPGSRASRFALLRTNGKIGRSFYGCRRSCAAEPGPFSTPCRRPRRIPTRT